MSNEEHSPTNPQDTKVYYRVEIFGNMSVYQDLLNRTKENDILRHFTAVLSVAGSGTSGKRMGDSVWPEENFICVAYCNKHEVSLLTDIIRNIQQLFLYEGIRMFAVPVPDIIIC